MKQGDGTNDRECAVYNASKQVFGFSGITRPGQTLVSELIYLKHESTVLHWDILCDLNIFHSILCSRQVYIRYTYVSTLLQVSVENLISCRSSFSVSGYVGHVCTRRTRRKYVPGLRAYFVVLSVKCIMLAAHEMRRKYYHLRSDSKYCQTLFVCECLSGRL